MSKNKNFAFFLQKIYVIFDQKIFVELRFRMRLHKIKSQKM